MPITHNDYVPILKWRQGEYQALFRLGTLQKDRVVPLIEVCPPEFDFETQQPAKSIDDHLLKFGPRLKTKWGQRPALIDAGLIDPDEQMTDGRHPLTYLLDEARKVNGLLVPVTGLLRHADYQEAVSAGQAEDGHGIAIRCSLDEFSDTAMGQNVQELVKILGVDIDEVDVIVDFANGNLQPVTDFALLLATLLAQNVWAHGARSITIAATSFPSSMAEITGPLQTVTRHEWLLYKELVETLPDGLPIPAFGDYAIAPPELIQGDMRLLKPSATVRYTINDAWMIAKGTNVRDNGFEQYRQHCATVVQSQHYLGSNFSRGSGYIRGCSTGAESTGNLTTWRWVGTNHHITKVISDLSTFYGP